VSMRAAVLGSPIEHSRSPLLHRTAYRELGLDWQYDALDVKPDELGNVLAGCHTNWVGLSLTMPLKVEVLPLLDELSPIANAVQVVNTVTFRDGRRLGDNTDVPALARLIGTAGTAATILGAGATARSAVLALQMQGVQQVTCWARRLAAAQNLASFAESLGLKAVACDGPVSAELLDAPIVVSALPGDAAQGWSALVHEPAGLLIDVSYDPWPPPLTDAWPKHQVVTGLDVLLEQAVLQVEGWTGQRAPRAAMRAALFSTVQHDGLD
jgi:shikimate dehydrogenase